MLGSSIAVTLFDKQRKLGGMAHYSRPIRDRKYPSNAFFAAPAIVWLVRELTGGGSKPKDLEAQVFGGACQPNAPDFIPEIHSMNVAVGLELLEKQGIWVSSMDVGGSRGRKVIFNSLTGESAVAKVGQIRDDDWYPKLESGGD